MKNNPTVDFLKLFFALGIVALHTGFLLNIQNGFYVHAIIFRLGVPFFFLASGYYLAVKNKNNDRVTFLKYIKRLIYLYIPLSILYMLANMFRYNNFSPRALLDNIWLIFTGRSQSVIWFVGALIVSCIVLMHLKEKNKLKVSLKIAAGIYVIGLLFNTYAFVLNNQYLDFLYQFLVQTFSNNSNALFEGYLFVGLGYYLNKYYSSEGIKNNIIFIVIGFVMLFIETFVVHNHLDSVVNYEYYFSHLLLIPSIFLLATKLNFNFNSILIRKMSSYIYYFHYIFIIILIWINNLYPSNVLNNPNYFYLITVLITVIFSILVYFFEKKTSFKNDFLKYTVLILYLVSFLVLLFSILILFNKVIWADEICSLAMIKNSFKDIFYINANDVHPPFYYCMLKIFVGFSSGLLPMANTIVLGKVFSFIPYILILILVNTKIRKNYGITTSAICTLLLTMMPQIIPNFVELRMYSWGMFLVLCSYIYLIDAVKLNRKKDWIIFTIFSVLSVYVHFYACLTMVFMYALALGYAIFKDKKLIKKIIISGVVVAICYIPWLLVIISHLAKSGSGFWISPITFDNVIEYVKYAIFPTSDYLGFNLILGLSWILLILLTVYKYLSLKKEEDSKFINIVGFLLLFLVVGCGIVVSILVNPLFVARYMYFAIGTFWFSIAIILGKLINKKETFVIIIFIPLLIGCINFNNFTRTEMTKNDYAESFYKKIKQIDKSADIIANEVHVQFLFAYYFPNSNVYYYKHDNASQMIKMYKNIGKLDKVKDAERKKVYYLENVYADDYKESIKKEGYKLKEIDNFSIDMYTMKLYEIVME